MNFDVLENGDLIFGIEQSLIDSQDDYIININYSAESIELYNEEKLIADNFYIDGEWNISVRHIARDLVGNKFILKINELRQEDQITRQYWCSFIFVIVFLVVYKLVSYIQCLI